jgi:hypothetical protein
MLPLKNVSINSKKYNGDGFNTSVWQGFRLNSTRWMAGYATGSGTVFGKTGRDPNGKGKTCFGWVSVRTMHIVGVEQGWEVGQWLKVLFL